MKYGDYKKVALKSIVAPGDIKTRMRAGHVKELAADIAELGGEPLNHIAVTKTSKGWRLIAGRDRFAALMLNGVKLAHVRVVVDATPDELHALEVSENLFRRVDDRDALIAARVAKVAERIEATEQHRSNNQSRRGPSKSVESQARDQVALALDVTPEAVRSAVRRATDSSEAKAPGPATPKRGAPPLLETFGRPMPPGMETNVSPILNRLKAIDQHLRQAQAEATALEITCCPPGVREGLQRALHEAAALVRAETPTHLCPYCYGEAGVRCKTCTERGFVTRAVFEASPREMRGELFDAGPAATPGEAMARARADDEQPGAQTVGDALRVLGVTVEEHAAGLDPEPAPLPVSPPRARAEKKKSRMRVKIGDGPERDLDEVLAEVSSTQEHMDQMAMRSRAEDLGLPQPEEAAELTVEREDDELWSD